MRLLKKLTIILLAVLMPLGMTGCWNNRPINTLGIVTGLGVDLGDAGGYDVTVQVVLPSKIGSAGQSGSQPSAGSSATIQVTANGPTVFEAVRNLIPMLSKKAYFSHIQLLVIGESAARAGLENIWDFFERDNEISRTMRIIVAKDATAKSVLEKQPHTNQIGAAEITETLESSSASGRNVRIEAFEVSELLSQPLTGIVLGAIQPGSGDSLENDKVEGAAVVKQGKLLGFLDNDETRGYLFAQNRISSTILSIANPAQSGRKVALEVIRSSGTITAEMKNGKPVLGIHIKTIGNIGDEEGSADLTKPAEVQAVEKGAEKLIRQNVEAAVSASQQTYGCDIFDFNTRLYKKDYRDFLKIKGNWSQVYSGAAVDVTAEFHLDRPGIINRPAFRN